VSEREISNAGRASASSALQDARLGAQSPEIVPNPVLGAFSGTIGPDDKAAVGTIKIILEAVNRRGRSRASLPDGTVLVPSSRQPFLDAARVLTAAGYDPDSWLEGWRPGATAFALRARLGIAAKLTVDETKTVFAKWKAFSQSAVSSSIGHSAEAATTLAAAPSASLQPSPRQATQVSNSATDCISAGTDPRCRSGTDEDAPGDLHRPNPAASD
jgi:hypothetical protein